MTTFMRKLSPATREALERAAVAMQAEQLAKAHAARARMALDAPTVNTLPVGTWSPPVKV